MKSASCSGWDSSGAPSFGTDIEAVFPSLKSEFGLPPIFHHHLDDSTSKLMNPFSVLSLFVSVYCSIKVLPGPPSISHHEVVLAKFEEAEHVEGIEGQCLSEPRPSSRRSSGTGSPISAIQRGGSPPRDRPGRRG